MINDPTQPIMTSPTLSTVWVTALVPEKDVPRFRQEPGRRGHARPIPDRVLHGKVLFVSRRHRARFAPQQDPHRLPNADYALKPNMFATVTLTGAQQSAVVLPSSALLMNNDRTSVFVATAPWTFERRTVEPELEEGSTVAIRSGLNAGEQVVVKGGILLND
jgi:membrane fusion protein, heavy metal efflux system